jgi:hypothetical protein
LRRSWYRNPDPNIRPADDNELSDASTPRLLIRLIFAYAGVVPNTRKCRVSFTDSVGITHSVGVAGASLYEAAALAVAEFRRCDFADATLGPATRLTVSVEAQATTHQFTFAKLSAWLDGGGKSPNEQALKVRLRELMKGA